MNKGFLTFSEDESGLTMLKEEPEDLTHLAPTAGDVCVPLVDHPYLSPEVLDEILLRENFSPLLTGNETTDPFISYRDTYDLSPQILSPNYSKNSDCSLPSLNSPSDSLGDDDQMSSFIGLHLDEDQEINKSAPYIPMNGIDDLPLLMQTSDLIWDHGVCSPSESNSNHGNLITDGSSLAELLSTSVNKHHIKINDHGGGIVNEDHMIGQYKGKSHTNWNVKNTLKTNQIHQEKTLRGSKRTNANSFIGAQNKKMKYEPKDSSNKMHSELLQQLITNTKMDSGRKNKNWLLNAQKAACVSQPSDSVLMNLLDSRLLQHQQRYTMPMDMLFVQTAPNQMMNLENVNIFSSPSISPVSTVSAVSPMSPPSRIRKNSVSLLNTDSEVTSNLSFMDLTEQDFEVNAPANRGLLQGNDLLMALDTGSGI